MAVKDNQHIFYYSASGTTVYNTSEEGERTQGMHQSNYKEINIHCS